MVIEATAAITARGKETYLLRETAVQVQTGLKSIKPSRLAVVLVVERFDVTIAEVTTNGEGTVEGKL